MIDSYVLNQAIKFVVRRRRPELPGLPPLTPTVTKLSFPSAHATTSFAAARVYSGLLPAAPLYAAAGAFAVSRPYLGVHYPSDVLAGRRPRQRAREDLAMKVGIVGMPNAGKTSLFTALTGAAAEAANYPFTTIEPNVAVVPVADSRLDAVADTIRASKVVPDTIAFHDIAGLVAGAHRGEGLGNQFLANIRETDAIVHVVRAHEDPNVVHPEGRVDPLADIETIETELAVRRPRAGRAPARARLEDGQERRPPRDRRGGAGSAS